MKSTYLFSQRIDCITNSYLDNFLKKRVQQKKRTLVFAQNLHILTQLSKDPNFQRKHQKANIIFCDGVPLLWMSKYSEHAIPERVSGTDLTERILQNKTFKVFLLGSSRKILRQLTKKYPNIVGSYSPPFGKEWNKKIDKKIITAINNSKASVLLVGVGALKQEKWLSAYLAHTNTVIGVGVGSAFDILSGEVPRAPKILRDIGCEWLWRILLEPKRLFFRYVNDFLIFIKMLILKI